MDLNQIISASFAIGAIFWAGATYQRIGRIEKDLTGLVGQLTGLAEIERLKANIQTHNEEIVFLRKAVFGEEWKRFGGPTVKPDV